MPQVVDVAKQLAPAASRAPRSSKSVEPSTRFKDAIDRQTRRIERSSEEAASVAQSEKPQEQPVKKVERKPADGANDPPVDSSEHHAEQPVDTAEAIKAESPATEEDPQGDAQDPAEPSDAPVKSEEAIDDSGAMLALLAQQPAIAPDRMTDAAPASLTPAIEATSTAISEINLATTPTAMPASPKGVPALNGEGFAEQPAQPAMPSASPQGAIRLPEGTEASTDDAPMAEDDDLVPSMMATPTATRAHDMPATTDEAIEPLALPNAGAEAKSHGAPAVPVGAQAVARPVAPAEEGFVENNTDKIVTSIRGQLMPTGGSMKIRLDPPNLGQLQIDVTVARDGTISAAFQTSNEDAAKLLSHSIQHLKNAIETAGVAVDRIQVRQASTADQSGSSSQQQGDRDQQQHQQEHPARQEQQRREMLQRMWARLAGASDDLDLVA